MPPKNDKTMNILFKNINISKDTYIVINLLLKLTQPSSLQFVTLSRLCLLVFI